MGLLFKKIIRFSPAPVLWLTILLTACSDQHQLPISVKRDIDTKVTDGLTTLKNVQGISLGIYTHKGTYTKGYGVADIETGASVNENTAFYIASSTKPLTALAMSVLDQRGEINLNATLTAFAPDAPFPLNVNPAQVKLKDLLSNSSGLRNAAIEERLAFTGQHNPKMLWRLLAHTKPSPKSPLGTFRYSNYNFNILTILTDKKLGKSWKDILATEVFAKAGMTRSTAYMSKAKLENWPVAHPHWTAGPGAPRRIESERVKVDATMHSAGGVIMSAADAVLWLEAMLENGQIAGKQVFPPAAIQVLIQPHVSVNKEALGYQRDSYGLGWYIGRYKDDLFVHHFGQYAGSRAHVSFMPNQKIGVAVFVNDSQAGSLLADSIANYVYDSLTNKTTAASDYRAALDKALKYEQNYEKRRAAEIVKRAKRKSRLSLPLTSYAGNYTNEFGESINVAVQDESLRITKAGAVSISEPYIRPEAIRVEFTRDRGQVIRFTASKQNIVEKLTFVGETYIK